MEDLLGEVIERPRLIFANLVDFDSLYGHRRNPFGYAMALEAFGDWFGLSETDRAGRSFLNNSNAFYSDSPRQ